MRRREFLGVLAGTAERGTHNVWVARDKDRPTNILGPGRSENSDASL
jgi:hypothetical protein